MARKKKTDMTVSAKQLEKWADESAAKELGGDGGNYISTAGGEFKFRGDYLSNPLRVIVLDTAFEHAYYPGVYDADNPTPPACFAISSQVGDGDELIPSDNSPDRQSDDCESCPMNEWGTDARGKGKACKNSRRLILISADDLPNLGKGKGEVDVFSLTLSPTSVKHWRKYFKHLTAVLKRPPFSVVTSLSLEKETKGSGNTYDVVKASFVEEVGSKLSELKALQISGNEQLVQEFDVSGYADALAANSRGKKKVGGRRAKVSKKKVTKKKVVSKKTTGKKTSKKATPKAKRRAAGAMF